jgi:hypothetical protein
MRRLKNALGATLFCALTAGCIRTPPVPDMSSTVTSPAGATRAPVTVPFTLDDNRVFVEVEFVRPDGTPRKALAFVNMGSGALVLSNALFRELKPALGRPLVLKIGAMQIAMDGSTVQPETMANAFRINLNPFSAAATAEQGAQGEGGVMAGFAAPLPVEAVLPPGLLQHFTVVFDYGARTMTLASPGTLQRPQGVAVPIRVNPKTGFATLDMTVDGTLYPVALDDGGSYTVLRSASRILAAHPGWLRSTGGVGEANYLMDPAGADASALVLKLPHAALGGLSLDGMGIVAPNVPGMLGSVIEPVFWDWYSAKSGETVMGWLAGNVLKSFRLTVDYPNRMSYWLQEAPLDTDDLDTVGITLGRWKGAVTIAAIAQKNGAATVGGVMPGDKLLKIDGADTGAMTRGQLLAALHGKPGDVKHLTLEREGKPVEVDAKVTAF